MLRRLLWLTVGVVLFLAARNVYGIDLSPGNVYGAAENRHARAVAEMETVAFPLGQESAERSNKVGHSSRSGRANISPAVESAAINSGVDALLKGRTVVLSKLEDAIFANGFEGEGAGNAPPMVCEPVPPLYPPDGLQWGGTQTLASLPEVGSDQLTQLKMQGGTWRAYSFTRADMPGDLTTLNADTSNVGPGGVGADARFWSVSECPGDFRPAPPCSGVINEGPSAYFDFSRSVPNTCPLDPSRSYFFNVHLGPAPCNSGGPNLCSFRFNLR